MKLAVINIFCLIFSSTLLIAQSPGSGNTLNFDGTKYVDMSTSFPDMGGQSFTVMAWIRPTNVTPAGQRVWCDDESNANGGYALSLGDPGSGRLRFYTRGVSPVSLDAPSTSLIVNNIWQHVAMVHDATTRTKRIFLNGVEIVSGTYTGTLASISGPASIGGETESGERLNRFRGAIDEVSFWTTALSATAIRDNMCQKLVGNETNLIGYWKFDQSSGTTLTDQTTNSYNGTLTNMTGTEWGTSGAPIGDESTYSYSVTTSTSLNITSVDGDDLTANVTAIGSTPTSIHLYRVDQEPNVTTPPGTQTQLSQLRYYGVRVFEGSGVIYTAIYNYDGHTGIVDENDLELATRDDNADATWAQQSATLNTIANTLTLAGQTGTEYILATVGADPLPIELLSFEAQTRDKEVDINWQTATEINNDYFTIERSSNGSSWEAIKRIQGAGNSSVKLSYSITDKSPYFGISYYRLKQTDFDGTYTYSRLRSVNISTLSSIQIFPNPVENQITISGDETELAEFIIFNTLGHNVTTLTKKIMNTANRKVIDITELKTGVYFLKSKTTTERIYKK